MRTYFIGKANNLLQIAASLSFSAAINYSAKQNSSLTIFPGDIALSSSSQSIILK